MARATHITLSLLAQRIEQLTGQIDELNRRLTRLVERHAPQLLIPVGIGLDSAVTLLITMGVNPERLNTEASFAALCGVSPIEYSSGQRSSRRLDHGGDRQANAALHRIVFTRLRFDPRTQPQGHGADATSARGADARLQPRWEPTTPVREADGLCQLPKDQGPKRPHAMKTASAR
ncbi:MULTISPECIES: transposase [Streptomyces]|uniref:Transposase n=2 Tax=Streptomyces TaxID=1883 RepID=A0ABV9J5B8_9ACTN